MRPYETSRHQQQPCCCCCSCCCSCGCCSSSSSYTCCCCSCSWWWAFTKHLHSTPHFCLSVCLSVSLLPAHLTTSGTQIPPSSSSTATHRHSLQHVSHPPPLTNAPLSHLFSSLRFFLTPSLTKTTTKQTELSLSLSRLLALLYCVSWTPQVTACFDFFFCKIEECPENCWSADQRMQTVKLVAMIICSRGAETKFARKKMEKRSKHNASTKP